MRLLNVHTLEVRQFSGKQIPRYAILSHTWGDDEVTFAELPLLLSGTVPLSVRSRERAALAKLVGCRQQTKRDGLDWFWIDSCCIDRTDAGEVAEAINSMYRWYQSSATCSVYLADVPSGDVASSSTSAFRRSRWFRRGWTLQELLAPTQLHFFDQAWKPIGSRRQLAEVVSEMTGISKLHIIDLVNFRLSVAVKLSWAAGRQTTREEDMAYCLIGLLGVVSMPLLYGEGKRAILRLQEEVIRQECHDETMLAWGFGSRNGLPATQPSCLAADLAFFGNWDRAIEPLVGTARNPFHWLPQGLLVNLPFIVVGDRGDGLVVLECGLKGHAHRQRVAVPVYIDEAASPWSSAVSAPVPLAYRTRSCAPFLITGTAVDDVPRRRLVLSHMPSISLRQALPNPPKALQWAELLDQNYLLADYFPTDAFLPQAGPDPEQGSLSTHARDVLWRFSRKGRRDDVFLIYTTNSTGLKRSLPGHGGYFAVASWTGSLASWEVLWGPDFKQADYRPLKRFFSWDTSIFVACVRSVDARHVRVKLEMVQAGPAVVAVTVSRIPGLPV